MALTGLIYNTSKENDREQWRRSLAEAGLTLVDGSFEEGATANNKTDAVWYIAGGQCYTWGGAFPKAIPALSTPASTGGVADGAWRPVGDITLRGLLVTPDSGYLVDDSNIAVKQPFDGSILRTQDDKNAEVITPKDFGAVGDGVTLDDAAFAKIEAAFQGKIIDLKGLTYSVTSAYIGNKYSNGTFKRADGTLIPAIYHSKEIRSGRYIQSMGQDALFSIPELPNGALATNLIAIGPRAMYNAVNVRNNYAIGYQALYSMQNGIYNTAFGFESLFSNNGTGDGTTGSRNAAFGDNTLRFNTTGYNNLAFGRNAGQTNETGNSNIHIGVASGTGDCPVDLNKNIINTFPTNKNNCVAVGTSTLFYTNSDGHTAIGSSALQYLKRGLNNTAVGFLAGRNLESDVGPTGKVMVTATATGNYSASGGVVIVTQAAHGYGDGDTVKIRFTSGPLSTVTTDYLWLQISVTSANTYTFSAPASLSGTGSTQVTARFTTADSTVQCDFNTALGYNALSLSKKSRTATAVGAGSLTNGGLSDNTAVGFRALALLAEDDNQIRNTALGSRAMEFMIDGSNCTNVFNSSAIGYQAYVSGNSQIQLGNSATTPYAYQALQLRSDARDKSDIRDMDLGIDFILGLRPVRGKWNLREDYYEEYDVQTGIDDNAEPVFEKRLRFNEAEYLAETKKRTREHEWFIAQEVDALCRKLGVDFSGLHHAAVDGGSDVYSLGYTAFIPPIVKAMQQSWKRMDEIEARLAKIEAQ